MKQRTIRQKSEFSGIGLHTGKISHVLLMPAPVNQGIRFYKRESDMDVEIPLSLASVKDTQLCSAIEYNGAKIKTVEHFMAALAMTGIDNISVFVSGDEMPIMDGSASPFVYLIKEAGIEIQHVPKEIIKVKRKIHVEMDDKYITIEPSKNFVIDYQIDFEHSAIRSTPQQALFSFASLDLVSEVARSRTFGFLKEIEYLQSIGLVKGGSFDNAIVLDDFKVLNDNGLRCDAEFVNHKILDAVGDFYVKGKQIVGKITAFKSGHALNSLALTELLNNEEAWELVKIESKDSGLKYSNQLINENVILEC